MTAKVIPIDTAKLKTKLDYALAYAAIDWPVFPLWWIDESGRCACKKCDIKSNSHGKHPLTAKGQYEATKDHSMIKQWWLKYPNANIGIYLAGGNLVAIDIDPRNGGMESIEQLEDIHGKIESDVLQFTGGGGEHRIFYVSEGIQGLPGKLGPGVDLKRNGYIVAEPSNHLSGGIYGWEASSNPLDGIAPSPLPDWIRDLSNQNSHQNASSEAISRLITPSQADELRSALQFIDANDRDIWVRTGSALKTIGATGWRLWYEYSQKSPKFNHKDLLRVWRSFKTNSLNIETIFFMARKNGWPGISIDPVLLSDIEPFIKKQQPQTFTLKKLPGVLGEIEDYYNATAKIPQPMFAQQTALGLLSVKLGRRFKTVFSDYSSLYFCNLTKSTNGKEHIKTTTEKILDAWGNKDLIAGDGYTSAGAVISALKEKPVHISIIDEFGLYLEASNNRNNHIGRSANTALMECIGRLNGEVRSKNYSTHGVKNSAVAETIVNPAITLHGLTTPATFYKHLTLDLIQDGFFGRFITVHSKAHRVPPRKVRELPVSKSIIEWGNAIDSRIHDALNVFFLNSAAIGEQVIIDVSPDAEDVLTTFSCEMVELMNSLESEGIDVIAGRAGEFAGRLALIIELAIDPYATCISKKAAVIAVAYMRDRTLELVTDIRENLNGSVYQAAKREILSAIRSLKNGVSEYEMHRNPPFAKYKDKELYEIIKALVSAELIALVNTREGKPGKKRMAYVALNDVDFT